MAELARATPVPGALREVALPTPLRGLGGDAEGARSSAEIPEAGSVIDGRYRLESVLGSGGMGVVFAARHLQTDKPVALKWLSLSARQRGSRDRAQALLRFAREARAAGRIRHPNVIDVYDASSDERTPYLVMERLEGETLRARLERAPLSWSELVAVLVPALRGVAELHRQGIVHRDLKPDNVFLAKQGDSDVPCAKVLDFGVSLLRSVDAHEDSLTGTGAVVGTPSYMPLEQLRGADEIDERTDVYALGVVLFEALTGKRPWHARSAGEYGALLASARPTRLSTLKPELRGAREATIMKALEREPGNRHQSVEAFITALLQADKPRSRKRAWLALAIALSVALLGLATLRPRAQQASSSSLKRQVSAPEASTREAQPAPAPAEPAPPAEPTLKEAAPPVPRRHAPRVPRVRESARQQLEQRLDALPSPQVSQPTDRATSLAREEF